MLKAHRSIRRWGQAVTVVLAAGGASLYCSPVAAQFGGTNTSGMFGQRNIGGATQFGNSGSGMGMSSGMGGAAGGMTGSGLAGNERFLQQNRQGAFVGADSGDTRNPRSQGGLNGGGLNNLFGNQGLFSQFNRQNQFRQNQNFNNNSNQKQLRYRLTMGTATAPVAAIPTSRTTAKFQRRLAHLPAVELAGPIEATLDGQTLVLRGAVASEGDRQMIEDLALLEPEVGQVRNELVVREAGRPAEALPAPTSVNRSSGR